MSKEIKKPKKKLTPMKKPLKVKWKDHFSIQGWSDNYNINPVIVTSFGVPLKETKEMLLLAQNAIYDTCNAGTGNNIAIMKSCIVSRKELK